MTEQLHFHFSLLCIGEGNGNPLQCSCLENPRDGVAQSQTGLKWLSSNSSSSSSRYWAAFVFGWVLIRPLLLKMWPVSQALSQPVLSLITWVGAQWCSLYILDHTKASFLIRAFLCAGLCLEDPYLRLLLGISLNFTSSGLYIKSLHLSPLPCHISFLFLSSWLHHEF